MIKIFPSIISAQLLNLQEEIVKLEPYCDGFHLDVMDFHFVSNLTFGPNFINSIAKICTKQLFLHLMVDNPQQWINILELRSNDIFSFHIESTNKVDEITNQIHSKKWLASISVNPETEIEKIYKYLTTIDQINLMSVEPGFSGQKFIESTISKLEQLNNYKKKNNLKFRIAMDGGINEQNIKILTQKGVNDFAISSAIFKTENPINSLEQLYTLSNQN